MGKIGGLVLAIIFVASVASSLPFVLAETQTQTEIPEFSSAVIVTTSSTTLTKAKEFMDNILLSLNSDSKVGPAVSQAAQLHKLFAHEDKEIKKTFQQEFLAFKKEVKRILGIGQGAVEKSVLNELEKSALKMKMRYDKEEEEEETNAMIDTAIELSQLKETLQTSMNEYIITEKTMKYGTDKDKKLADLKQKNINLMKEMYLAHAKHNNKKLDQNEIKQIEQKAIEDVENSGGQKNNNSDNGKDSDNGKGSNNGKGSDKGSDKGNSGKNSGKGNGKSKK